jgi:hypothetical protein
VKCLCCFVAQSVRGEMHFHLLSQHHTYTTGSLMEENPRVEGQLDIQN